VSVKCTVLGNMLADTPLVQINSIEFVSVVAVARIAMPLIMEGLFAGRESTSKATQALRFMTGANSIFSCSPQAIAAVALMLPCLLNWDSLR
jgi:biotin synthase